ncbi:helix-turn-helix domain-containing protein [Streptomyces phaeochromogenes]|uniref:hypothetical protein n=1 Tax=Streptomyces phaeochromogenes TaxID=1923 RepID=UPI002E2CB5D6|nr:hypothetical protein [Streptomyces phaeochromogenes]
MNTEKNGYFQYQKAIQVSDLTPQERLLALTFASSYNWDEENDSYCGIYRLAAMTGLSKSRVSTYKASLIEKGWLESNRRFSKSSTTRPTFPAGFDVKALKAKQDALVEEQNKANKARVAKSRTKKDDEIAALKAELEAFKKAQEAPVEPAKEEKAPEVTETVTEPYETSQSLTWPEMTDAEMQEALDLDPFEDEKPAPIAPVVEKKAPTKKAKKEAVAEKNNLVKKMLDERRAKSSFEDDFVASRLGESDNPEKAQALFDDEEFSAKYPDKVQRAAQAAFEVQGDRVTV